MPNLRFIEVADLYAGFHSPIAHIDCGKRCAPYNEKGIPFCCDTHHAVPTAYDLEWDYLKENTNLWHLWKHESEKESKRLISQTPRGQVLIECLGHTQCQREYRSFTCRAFPFFPYLDKEGNFIGLSYYWEYADRCWIISHLASVTPEFLNDMIITFDKIFLWRVGEKENFRFQSLMMRRIYGRKHHAIPLLHRNGGFYKITPSNGRLRRFKAEEFPKFNPYRIADLLPFPDETE